MEKFILYYALKGEIEIEAKDIDDAVQRFYDRVGVSTDEIYENATTDEVNWAERVEE